MARLVIQGGKKLSGRVRISGSKNAVLPCLVASLLTKEDVVITNVPELGDVVTSCQLLELLGKKIVRSKNKLVITEPHGLTSNAPYELVSKMRASALVMGPLVVRCGAAEVSLPGGCAIGTRPVDIHLFGLKTLGAEIKIEEGYVKLKAKSLVGTTVLFPKVSVGATEHIIMASVLAEGKTVIKNAAQEPEIVDLADMLNAMGARIIGAGTPEIYVEGVKNLSSVEHDIIADRIEAGTFMVAAAITRGRLVLEKMYTKHLEMLINKLCLSGVEIEKGENSCIVNAEKRKLVPVDIETSPYPGFATDLQAQWMAYMCTVPGRSVVRETIFENRFMHVGELQRMGAKVQLDGNTAIVEGQKNLSGAKVMATDLRASAALVLAGLAAEGCTQVSRIYHLDRGYENIEKKLRSVGANIKRYRR
ncbi:MAG: UDP-N-acetylglucosamine 1-carboxyvinyltransferase [Elusimicrobiota bacterium]